MNNNGQSSCSEEASVIINFQTINLVQSLQLNVSAVKKIK